MVWWDIILRVLTAVIIGCVIGTERERKNRPAGTRTHILVCVGAALIAIIENMMAESIIATNLQNPDSGTAISMGRLSAQVISGIGFLGAGTIFMTQKKIAGLTTAASLWCTACLGLASGMGYYALAAGVGLVVVITLTLMQRIAQPNSVKHLEVKFIHRIPTLSFLNSYFEEAHVNIIDVDFQVDSTKKEKVYTNLYTITLPKKTPYKDLVIHLSEYENIVGVRTKNV